MMSRGRPSSHDFFLMNDPHTSQSSESFRWMCLIQIDVRPSRFTLNGTSLQRVRPYSHSVA